MAPDNPRRRWFGARWSSPIYLLIGFAIAVVALWVIGIFLFGPLEDALLRLFDRPIRDFIIERRTGWLTDLMKLITLLGSNFVFIIAGFALAFWSYVRTRDPFWPVFVAVTVIGALFASSIVKELVARPRPGGGLVAVGGLSFPSGHSVNAAAMAGMFGFFLTHRQGRSQTLWIWRGLGLVAFLIAFSRVYLGVHWPVDILAGLGLGSFWVSIAVASLKPDA